MESTLKTMGVKDVVKNLINKEWFLPPIQRTYVWADRHEAEKYICRLFDSVLNGYPIGNIIIWTTYKDISYREFSSDFKSKGGYKLKESGINQKKSLVYDGQQRLQTLFCGLTSTINGRTLVFNLNYNETDEQEREETGFRFVSDTKKDLKDFEVSMPTIFKSNESSKIEFRKKYCNKTNDENSQVRIERNLDKLWKQFVENNPNQMSVSEIKGDDEAIVNDIFERLNTGGIQLSMADLLYSKIKAVKGYEDFESKILDAINNITIDTSIEFTSYDLLQILHIIVKGRSRIDEKVSDEDIELFVKSWDSLYEVLKDFTTDYLVSRFHINRMSIVNNKFPLIDLIVFLYYYRKETGNGFKKLSDDQKKRMDKFFILAEITDWTLQSYTDNFCRILKNNDKKEIFPLEEMIDYVKERGNRDTEINENNFCDKKWFALKIIFKGTTYDWSNLAGKRYNPELDHIFPKKLKEMKDNPECPDYQQEVDVLWNLQPIKGDENIEKSNSAPKEYFQTHPEAFEKYEMVPSLDDDKWEVQNYRDFIAYRKKLMIQKVKDLYDIEILENKDNNL